MDDFSNADVINPRNRPNGGIGIDGPGQGIKDTVGRKLESAAGLLREKADEAQSRGSGLARIGTDTANGIDRVASYVRDADAQKVRQDIEQTVRQNPGKSLIIAGVAGLLLGAILRRR
jgi:ElaB/YqjD/DUF883 family membrane-anchored ribosome-binding protein